MTMKPEVKAIVHLHTGATVEETIQGPPFPPTIGGEQVAETLNVLRSTFYHRNGQDPASLEQHYDLDKG